MTNETVLLSGVVGSTAYGLAREGSDVDRLGVFAAPTLDIAGLSWGTHKETHVSHEPDFTKHEIAKFLRLVMKGNPTVTELLWLPKYDLSHSQYGPELVGMREHLSSTKAVSNAYIGYATAQAKRLETRGDDFGGGMKNRTAKHGRHMLRLLRQGVGFLVTGRLEIVIDDPSEYWAFDAYTVPQMLEVYQEEMVKARMAEANSVLPDQPHRELAQQFLDDIRIEFMERK